MELAEHYADALASNRILLVGYLGLVTAAQVGPCRLESRAVGLRQRLQLRLTIKSS